MGGCTVPLILYDFRFLNNKIRVTLKKLGVPESQEINLKALEKLITRTIEETTEETRSISVSTENAVDVELELGYETGEKDQESGASLELAFSHAWVKEWGAGAVSEISAVWLGQGVKKFVL